MAGIRLFATGITSLMIPAFSKSNFWEHIIHLVNMVKTDIGNNS